MNACSVDLLKILRIVRIFVDIVKYTAPAVLVLFIIIDVVKTVSSNDVDTKKLSKSIGKRVIAAVAIFITPVLIDLCLSLFSNNLTYAACYKNANKTYIVEVAQQEADKVICEIRENDLNTDNADWWYGKLYNAVQDIPDKSVRAEYKTAKDNVKKAIMPTPVNGSCES